MTLDDRESRLQQDSLIDALDRLKLHGDVGIKDSHVGLDLNHRGFTARKGQWIGLDGGQDSSVVTDHAIHWAGDAAAVRAWMQAASFVAFEANACLAHPSGADAVGLLSIRDGTQIIAGAICTTFGAGIGISNVFGATDVIPVWPLVVQAARRRFGDRPLVGWEFEADLDAPILAGFRPLHALQVWIRPGAAT